MRAPITIPALLLGVFTTAVATVPPAPATDPRAPAGDVGPIGLTPEFSRKRVSLDPRRRAV